MQPREDIPVYLFTGFLESGKTQFIKDTLKDPKFSTGEKTLVIACEDGEEQYEQNQEFIKDLGNVTIKDFGALLKDFNKALKVELRSGEMPVVDYLAFADEYCAKLKRKKNGTELITAFHNFNNSYSAELKKKNKAVVTPENFEEFTTDFIIDITYLNNVDVVFVEAFEDFTEDFCDELEMKYQPDRVMLEYNGMWSLAEGYQILPQNWVIAEQIMTIDSSTFMSYNTMFRNTMVEKIAGAQLVVFNRFSDDYDKYKYHQIVRAVSRQVNIYYEYTDGTGENDDIQDPLPFDIDAPVIEIEMNDYALWIRDVFEEPDKYAGKKCHFAAKAVGSSAIANGFGIGRPVMTCCVQDIRFMGFLCENATGHDVPVPGWYDIQAEIVYEYQKRFRKKVPSLKASAATPMDTPEDEVATFY